MTKARRLVPLSEIQRVLDMLDKRDFEFNHVDIRADGVSFSNLPSPPAPATQGPALGKQDAYEEWQSTKLASQEA